MNKTSLFGVSKKLIPGEVLSPIRAIKVCLFRRRVQCWCHLQLSPRMHEWSVQRAWVWTATSISSRTRWGPWGKVWLRPQKVLGLSSCQRHPDLHECSLHCSLHQVYMGVPFTSPRGSPFYFTGHSLTSAQLVGFLSLSPVGQAFWGLKCPPGAVVASQEQLSRNEIINSPLSHIDVSINRGTEPFLNHHS